MGVAASVSPAAGNSIFGDFAGHPSRPRDGALPALPLLRGARYATVLYSCSDHDWDIWRGDPDQGAHPLTQSSVRYRNRGSDRRIRSCRRNAHSRVAAVKTSARRNWPVRLKARLPLDFRSHARISQGDCSRRSGGELAFASHLSSSDGGGSVGGNVRDGAESSTQQPAGRRTHRLRAYPARASDRFVVDDCCARLSRADESSVVVLGRASCDYELLDLPAAAGSRVPAVADESLAAGAVWRDHAGLDFCSLPNSSGLALTIFPRSHQPQSVHVHNDLGAGNLLLRRVGEHGSQGCVQLFPAG